jgi:DNA helicase-2/ATP-dependent DNA helicase PcrA
MVYETCPFQYFQQFVLGIPPPVTPAMRRGTGIHSLISKHFGQSELPFTEIEPTLQELFKTFQDSRFNLAPVASEQPFTLAVEGAQVRGRIDLILPGKSGDIELVDFKSGSTRTREELAHSLQLPLYALAASTLYARQPEELSYTYFFLRDGAEVSFRATPESFEALGERVTALVRSIGAKRFDPTPGCHCHACLFPRRKGRHNARSPG